MAIPRYKTGQISAQTETEKFSGLPDEAAARGQAKIASEAKGLAAQKGQRANQEVQSFSQRLNMFVSQASDMMQTDAIIKAKKQGITDVATRRKEIADIQNKHRNNPDLMQKKIDEVTTATKEDNFSFYGRTYQNSVSTAYTTQVEVDAATAANEAQAYAQEDPALFKQMYAPYRDEVVSGAPNEQTSIAAQQAFDKHGANIFSKMTMAKYAKDQAQLESNEVGNLEGLKGMALDSAARGDTAGMSAALGQLEALAHSRYRRGKIGVYERDFLINEARVGTQVNSVMREGNMAANSGQGWSYIDKLQNPNHKFGKQFAALPEDAQQDVLTRMDTAIKTYRNNEYAKEKHENEKTKVFQENNLTYYLDNILKSGKNMTASELKKLQSDSTLSEAGVKEIIDFQNEKTIPEVLAKVQDGATLVNMSVDQILNLPDISYDDKRKLLSDREAALKDPLYDWTKSRYGKRALDYLAEDYNIPKDNIAVMMAAMDQDKTETQKQYEEDRRELTRRIEAYPYDKQPENAMAEYDKMKREREVKKEDEATDTAEANLQTEIESVREISRESMDSMFISDVSPLEAAKKKYERKDITFDTYEKIKARLSGQTSPPKKKHLRRNKPGGTVSYKAPTYKYEARANEWGYETPEITGQKVNIARVRANVKKSAFPIMNKYGLTIEDGFRSTPGKGATGSQHLHGNALDVSGWGKLSTAKKQEIIREFKAAGFNGFGVGPDTLHVDMRKNPGSWSYFGTTSSTGKGGIMPKWATEAIGG